MEFYCLKYSVHQRTAVITLDWPEKQNALDNQMVAELTQAFLLAQKDSSVRVITLRAEGDMFCSDMEQAYVRRVAQYDFNQNLQDSTDLVKLFMQISTLRKPVIALVQGPALAGGCGLAAVCDFIVAAKETARFGLIEPTIGWIPAIVLTFLVRRIGEGRTREFALRGRILNAEEALDLGLISRVVPSVELEQTGRDLAEELMTNNSGASMGLIKELLSRTQGMPTSDAALEYAANLNALARMTDECKRGVEGFLNNQQTKW